MERFAPVDPDLAALWESLKSAYGLYVVLIDLQCDAEGRINYGRAFGYAWLLARWPGNPDDRPCIRTLKYHMAKLKKVRLVHVRVRGHGGGMTVTMINSKKWANKIPTPAVQLPLLSPPVAQIRVDNPVEKQLKASESQKRRGQEFAPVVRMGGKLLPRKEVKKQAKETNNSNPASQSRASPVEDSRAVEDRRQLLAAQFRMLLGRQNQKLLLRKGQNHEFG